MAIRECVAFFATILCAAILLADDATPVEIPLKDIWAYQMPGTKDIRDLNPDSYGRVEGALTVQEREQRFKDSLVQQIYISLGYLPDKRSSETKSGFAVSGTGMEALRAARDVLVDKVSVQKLFDPGTEVSVIFFSHPSKYGIVIDGINKRTDQEHFTRGGRVLEVVYHFVPRRVETVSECFALIPIGKMPDGPVLVRWRQKPTEGEPNAPRASATDSAYAAETICKEFLIASTKPPNNETAAKDWASAETAIPLSDVWAWNIPGTRQMDAARQKDSQKYVAPEGEMLDEIRHALALPFSEAGVAKPGFAVLGSGREALQEAKAVLVDHKPPRDKFPTDNEISLVFFSHQAAYYCRLKQVLLKGDHIEIQYQFVPHNEKELTAHFAIIPIGKLVPGSYKVDLVQSPLESAELAKFGMREMPSTAARRLVCKSFSFSMIPAFGN